MTDTKNIVLALSGGLDTSYCVPYLKQEHNANIHTVLVNTGGFTEKEIVDKKAHALALGADTHQSLDQIENFYEQVVRYLIYGNVLKNNTYPLSVSSERVF